MGECDESDAAVHNWKQTGIFVNQTQFEFFASEAITSSLYTNYWFCSGNTFTKNFDESFMTEYFAKFVHVNQHFFTNKFFQKQTPLMQFSTSQHVHFVCFYNGLNSKMSGINYMYLPGLLFAF